MQKVILTELEPLAFAQCTAALATGPLWFTNCIQFLSNLYQYVYCQYDYSVSGKKFSVAGFIIIMPIS